MVAHPGLTTLGLEYFCNQGDGLWTRTDADLKALAAREIAQLGLVRPLQVMDGTVVRVSNAYPVYDSTYSQQLAALQKYLAGFSNLQSIGRNGLHRYNNQDHSMITGLIAARNLSSSDLRDVWSVNSEAEYHEAMYEDAA